MELAMNARIKEWWEMLELLKRRDEGGAYTYTARTATKTVLLDKTTPATTNSCISQ